MADNIWCGNGDDKLYHQSGFTSTLKTSISTASEDNTPIDVSYDGANVAWAGSTNDKFWLWSGVFSTTLIDSQSYSLHANAGHPSSNDNDTPWCGNDGSTGSKLYIYSGKFTNTLKDSQEVHLIDGGINGCSVDGFNTPWCGLNDDKLYLTSGQFTSTLKTSLDVFAVNGNGTGISFDGTNTPWCGNTGDILYLQSGQFTSTIKESVDVNSIDTQAMGIETLAYSARVSISVDVTVFPTALNIGATAVEPAGVTNYETVTPNTLTLSFAPEDPYVDIVDGENDTFWADGQARALYLQSGEFSTTLKTSLYVGLIESGLNGISWDGVDTFAIGRTDDKMYKWSGVMTSTLKTSEATPDINPHGISVDSADTMWGADQINKLMWQSGKFTSTVKDSEDIFALDWSITSVSWDGDNTPWSGQQNSILFLTSGRFTSTIKTSHNVNSIDTLSTGITFNNPDTLWCGDGDDKLYKMLGQFSSTMLASRLVTAWGTAPRGIETADFAGRSSGIFYVTPSVITMSLAAHDPFVFIQGDIVYTIAAEVTMSLALHAPTISVSMVLLLPDVPMPTLETDLSLHDPTITITDDVRTIVANTRNFAISEYASFAYNSMCKFNGKYLYAKADGIYEGGGDDDNGTKIDASYKTGSVDVFATEVQKIRNAFCNFRSNGDIQLFSVGDKIHARSYNIINSTIGTIHERRVKFERGIRQRHFNFGVSNINGSTLEVDSIKILTEPIRKRR